MNVGKNKSSIASKALPIALAGETFIAIVFLLGIERDPQNSFFLGFSASRLAMAAALTLAAVVFILWAFHAPRVTKFFTRAIEQRAGFLALIAVFSLLTIAGLFASQIPLELLEESQVAAYIRIRPILVWTWVISLQLALYVLKLKYGFHFDHFRQNKKLFKLVGFALIGLGAIFLFIFFSGVGINPDKVGWNRPTSPVLAWQIWLSVLIGAIFSFTLSKFKRNSTIHRWLQWIIPITIFLVTVLVWNSEAIPTSYYAPRVRQPNFEVYPYSDAAFYNASAESVLLGNGLMYWQVVPRPMMLTILSFIVLAAKGEYSGIIFLQTILLALIPVGMYLLGSKMAHRGVGMGLAVLSIFREVDAIYFSRHTTTASSKMILSDLPTHLLLILLSLAVIYILIKKKKNLSSALWLGGLLGFVLLFRTQAAVFVPIILILLLLQIRSFRGWLLPAGAFILGSLLIITPWVVRNAIITGGLAFDDPKQLGMIVGRYQTGIIEEDDQAAGQVGGSLISVIVQHPLEVLNFVGGHFVNNEIASLLSITPQPLVSTLDYLNDSTGFWETDGIRFTPIQGLLLTATLIVMVIGIVFSFVKLGLAGLVPLLIQAGYHLSNALARNSGGRYVLPVDWVNHLYFLLGIFFIISLTLRSFGCRKEDIPERNLTKDPSRNRFAMPISFGIILLLAAGSFIPLTELLFSRLSYAKTNPADTSPQDVMSRLDVDEGQKQQMLNYLDAPNTVVRYGLELYPRFYPSNEGEAGSYWAAYSPMDSCRMGFILLEQEKMSQAFIYLKNPPEEFPSRQKAILIGENVGNESTDIIKVKYVLLEGEEPILIEGLDNPIPNCRSD